MQLVSDAISAGVLNDLGSGSNVDLCVITKDKADYIRPHRQADVKPTRYVILLSAQIVTLRSKC